MTNFVLRGPLRLAWGRGRSHDDAEDDVEQDDDDDEQEDEVVEVARQRPRLCVGMNVAYKAVNNTESLRKLHIKQ